MKSTKLIDCILELLCVFGFLYLITKGEQYLVLQGERYYTMTRVIVYRTVTPMLFGGLTRIPSLISRWHDGGRFNLARFLVLVVPGILILLQPILSLFFGSRILFPLSMQTLFAYGIAVWTGATFVDCIKGNDIR